MPSFLDMLQSSSDEPGGDAPLDVLASVKTEGGRRRRRRHRRNVALSGLALALVAVPALALVGGSDDPERVDSADFAGPDEQDDRDDAPETGAGVPQSTTTTIAPVTEVAGVVITQVPEQPVETVPPTTAPPLVCENSTNPECGEFYWSPEPANGPLTLTAPQQVTIAASDQPTPIEVAWSDPDASLTFFDDDGDDVILGAPCQTDRDRFGPWSPPEAAGGSGSFVVQYPPKAPGQYVLTVVASTRNGDCIYDPYGSDAMVTINITVE